MLLIEKRPSEKNKDVEAFLDAVLVEIYGRRPEWLEFELRETFEFKGRLFIEVFCRAGSVFAQISRLASINTGLDRDILQIGMKEGRQLVWLLHEGVESQHGTADVQRIS
jgi:hypothetical protein